MGWGEWGLGARCVAEEPPYQTEEVALHTEILEYERISWIPFLVCTR